MTRSPPCRGMTPSNFNEPRDHPQPLVSPQVSHLAHAPLRTSVKLKHLEHASPS